MSLTTQFRQCDICTRMTTRVHHCTVTGIDTTACDECFGYDYGAYDEAPAEYMTEAEWSRDRDHERYQTLLEAMQDSTAMQVAEAILNIFSDKDIGLICGRLITPRRQT